MRWLKGTSRMRPCWLRKGTLSLEWPGKRVGWYDAESEVRLRRSRSLRRHRPVFGERSVSNYLPLDGLGPSGLLERSPSDEGRRTNQPSFWRCVLGAKLLAEESIEPSRTKASPASVLQGLEGGLMMVAGALGCSLGLACPQKRNPDLFSVNPNQFAATIGKPGRRQ